MRTAERRYEVIQRNLIRNVDHGESQADLVVIRSEQNSAKRTDVVKTMYRYRLRELNARFYQNLG